MTRLEKIQELGACKPAVRWLKRNPKLSTKALWRKAPLDWKVWYLEQVAWKAPRKSQIFRKIQRLVLAFALEHLKHLSVPDLLNRQLQRAFRRPASTSVFLGISLQNQLRRWYFTHTHTHARSVLIVGDGLRCLEPVPLRIPRRQTADTDDDYSLNQRIMKAFPVPPEIPS